MPAPPGVSLSNPRVEPVERRFSLLQSDPDQPGLNLREQVEVGIQRDQTELMLQRQRRDPKVRLGQNAARPLGLAAQAGVGEGRSRIGAQDFEAAQKLLSPHQGLLSNPCQQLTVEEFTHDRNGQDRRIMMKRQGLDAPVLPAEQFQRARIKEQGHG